MNSSKFLVGLPSNSVMRKSRFQLDQKKNPEASGELVKRQSKKLRNWRILTYADDAGAELDVVVATDLV